MSGIERGEVLRYLGHRGQVMSPELSDKLDCAMVLCLTFAQPRRVWAVAEDAALQLPGTRKTAVFAVTLGHDLAREIDAQQHRDMALAAMLDASATALVESVCDGVEREIGEWAGGAGLFPCPRVSPGYGALPLALHRPILRALDAERRIGLTATGSLMLMPRKSVTGLVGMSEAAVDGARGCEGCRGACSYRR